MPGDSLREQATAVMRRINQEWLAGRVDALAPLFHPEIVMVFPGFTAEKRGREALLAGFRDFVENARVAAFQESDHLVSVAGKTAIVSYRFEMMYERSGKSYRSTGRDLWVFHQENGELVATWRTMLDVEEKKI